MWRPSCLLRRRAKSLSFVAAVLDERLLDERDGVLGFSRMQLHSTRWVLEAVPIAVKNIPQAPRPYV